MESLVNQLDINEKDIDFFKENGFIVLRQLLNTKNTEVISDLKEIIRTAELENPLSNSSGIRFEKQIFGIEDYALVQEIFSSNKLTSILGQLSKKEIKFAQASVLKLAPEETGFTWHLDLKAFHYMAPKDFGFTLWVPLEQINREDQGGGVECVSRRIYSGYEDISLIHQMVQEDINESLTIPEFDDIREASNIKSLVFDKNKVTYDFEIGDVLF